MDELFWQNVIFGLTVGGYLALIALGYTMVYGIIELINFAHGDLFAFGFFISLTIFGLSNSFTLYLLPFFDTLGLLSVFEELSVYTRRPLSGAGLYLLLPSIFILTMLLTGSLNLLIDSLAYRPLRSAPRLAPLLTAVGMSFALEATYAVWKGALPINYPSYFPRQNYLRYPEVIDFFDKFGIDLTKLKLLSFTTKDAFLLGVTIPLVVLLTLFVDKTRIGKAMRACAQDREAAAMMGISVNWIIAMTFFVGGALAGGAGLTYGLYLNSGRFDMGFQAGLIAFTAAVLGGIGNIRGAVLGAFVIGMVKAMSDSYIGGEWTRVVIFGMLILMLVFRPSGILGSTQSVEKV